MNIIKTFLVTIASIAALMLNSNVVFASPNHVAHHKISDKKSDMKAKAKDKKADKLAKIKELKFDIKTDTKDLQNKKNSKTDLAKDKKDLAKDKKELKALTKNKSHKKKKK